MKDTRIFLLSRPSLLNQFTSKLWELVSGEVAVKTVSLDVASDAAVDSYMVSAVDSDTAPLVSDSPRDIFDSSNERLFEQNPTNAIGILGSQFLGNKVLPTSSNKMLNSRLRYNSV